VQECKSFLNRPAGREGAVDVADRLETLEIATGESPEFSIIWLHGLGADGHDFEPIVPELRLPFAARFVFPHAPVRPVTINQGLRMRAWFDIAGLAIGAREDEAGLRASGAAVEALIAREIGRGVAARSIVLAGFSQGGAVALHVALRHRERLAGVLALSTFLMLADSLEREKSAANADLPILLAHGSADPMVPLAYAQWSRDRLIEAGYAPDWRTYAMAHAVCGEEIRDIALWLKERRGETP
jgi:phospholipase/carboxylesterase